MLNLQYTKTSFIYWLHWVSSLYVYTTIAMAETYVYTTIAMAETYDMTCVRISPVLEKIRAKNKCCEDKMWTVRLNFLWLFYSAV